MMSLLDWSVGQRLGAGFSLIAAVLLAFVFTVLSWQHAGDEAQREYVRHIAPRSEQAFAVERALLHADIAVRAYLIAPEAARQMETLEAIDQAQRAERLLSVLPKDRDGEKLMAALDPTVQGYLEQAAKLAKSSPRLINVDRVQIQLSDLRRRAAENLRAYLELQGSKAQATITEMERAREKVSAGMVSAVALVLGVLALLAFFTMEMVRRPTRALLQAAAEMERGHWKRALDYSAQTWGTRSKTPPRRNELARIGLALGIAARALEQRESRLLADARVAAAASSSLEREPMASEALRAMVDATGAIVGAIYWHEIDSGTLRPIARHGLAQPAVLQDGEGVPGEAVRQARPIVIRDIPKDGPYRLRVGIDEWQPQALAAFPIALRGEVLGVAVLGALRDFDAAALEFLTAACLQLAIGLKNVRSHEEVQRLVAELRESGEQIQAQNEELQAQQEELQSQGEQLQSQNEQLQDQSEALKSRNDLLARQARELTAADEHKNEFLGLLAHELRNPLAAISHSIYILGRDDKSAADDAQGRAVIERQMRHLTRMVDDLLDVTRISRGKVRLQRETLDLAQLAREVLNDWQAGIARAGVRLEAQIADAPMVVDGDRTRLAQVLGNLLSNALKFTERGGRIALSLAPDAARNRAMLCVADSGIGMDGALIERLFRPFSQGETGLARGNGGLGLGLALAKALVELHGGTIEAHSDGPGRGAEFVVELPLVSAAVPAPVVTLAAPHARRPRRILVVEDNVDAAQTLATALAFEGHEVRTVQTGPDGVEAALAMRPDVVLCDLGIPGIDGYEVARRLRREEALRATRLVALSGYASADDQRRSAEAGFDRHLSKPVNIEELFALLGDLGAPTAARMGRAVRDPVHDQS